MEVFYNNTKQYTRDLKMVRDLLVAIDQTNRKFRSASLDIKVVAGIRTEVLEAIGALQEEVSKVVNDFGYELTYSAEKVSPQHSVVKMLDQKLGTQRRKSGFDFNLKSVFPDTIEGVDWYRHLIDSTLARPRNVISRLKIIQEQFPGLPKFTEDSFVATNLTYSRRVLEELTNFLSAEYPKPASDVIIKTLQYFPRFFLYDDFEKKVLSYRGTDSVGVEVLKKRGLPRLLEDLYDFSVIGNYIVTDFGSPNRQVWKYRGGQLFDANEIMVIHDSLSESLQVKFVRPPNR